MQTPPLPIQVSGASASPAPTRATGSANHDKAQFSRALSREINQRQHGAAPAPAKAAAPAQAADGKTVDGAGPDEARDDAADAAAVSPVTDMLALAASFKLPVAAADKADGDGAGIALPTKVAADAKGLSIEDGAPATDAATAFALKMLPGAPAAASEPAALAGASAQASAADGDSAAAFKAAADKAALRSAPVQPDPVRSREAEVAALKDLPAAAPLTAPAQQASAAIAQAVAGAPAERIAARVGTPAWDNQVGQKIVWMVAGKEQSASLTLNPPDMGPMQVVLNVTNDQATVTFTAAQPEVRQALENALPKLREMMSESGIALGNATVNAGSPDQRQAQQGGQSRGGAGGRLGGGASDTAVAAVTARPLRSGGGEGLVDTFA